MLNNKYTNKLKSYNLTKFPNTLKHSNYTTSNKKFHQFLNLINSSYNPSLLPFLYNTFYPKYNPLTNTILPPYTTKYIKSLSQYSFLFTFYKFN